MRLPNTSSEGLALAQEFFDERPEYREMNPSGTIRRVAVLEFCGWLIEKENDASGTEGK